MHSCEQHRPASVQSQIDYEKMTLHHNSQAPEERFRGGGPAPLLLDVLLHQPGSIERPVAANQLWSIMPETLDSDAFETICCEGVMLGTFTVSRLAIVLRETRRMDVTEAKLKSLIQKICPYVTDNSRKVRIEHIMSQRWYRISLGSSALSCVALPSLDLAR